MPGDWPAIVRRILTRDPVCQLAYPGTWTIAGRVVTCTRVSREVDHIGTPTDHRPDQLRGVCPECHQRRTLAQAADGRRLAQSSRDT